ncbi:MAG: hypothetical protein L6Q76_22405 [Polyangiaceae bacterium]|nr:hypothetical protein [Polyangiaceae bacterium]
MSPYDKDGNPRKLEREHFEKAGKLVQVELLQRDIYTQWGVKIEVEDREDEVVEIFDEAMEVMPQALTEQRERLLDLIDRIIGAMVEESCPPRKPPEDWDWGGIFQGFREHFGVELPDEISTHIDPEQLAHELFDRAEEVFLKREKEFGTDFTLRVFRHIYLEELDKAWVDHLTDMDHLRDGIGLRGYGQKDPKQEYKKEGYNLFVNMVARVSSNVITKLFSVQVRRAEDEEAIEAADAARHAEQLKRAVAKHDEEPAPLPAPEPEPLIAGDQECPCGSGKPFLKCHGAEDEATV